MNIVTTKRFDKQLEKHNSKSKQRLANAIDKLPDGDVLKMKGHNTPTLYRLRVGDYRIIFMMEVNIITLIKLDSRGDVYKD
ncbi:MAG: type II toxin-antitoxin system RelE/ParE family toxin [Candidatus Sericytochromatia bacterium]|nr:type II toxin-antitoxin system RelE/ParE family toxin [Candidatus Sericytochromatia bacterium]